MSSRRSILLVAFVLVAFLLVRSPSFAQGSGARSDLRRALDGELYFDFGPADAKVAPGYIGVPPTRRYSRETGYGFESVPGESFSEQSPVEESARPHHPMFTGVVPELAIRDGVESDDQVTFLADVPRIGPYLVYATVGRYSASRLDQEILLESVVIAENVDCFRAVSGSREGMSAVTVKGMVEASNGVVKVTVRVKSTESAEGSQREASSREKSKATLLAVRLRPLEIEPGLASLPEGSALRRALELEERLRGLDDKTRKEEIRDLENLVALYRDALDTEVDERAAWLYVVRDRFESATRLLDAKKLVALLGYSSADRATGTSVFERYWGAYVRCSAFDEGDPLWARSELLRGRIAYWISVAQPSQRLHGESLRHFEKLRLSYPEHRIVGLYTGQRLRSPQGPVIDVPGAPRWAVLQREALARTVDIIRFWAGLRQEVTGEMGGGWSGDVEMLRHWEPAVLATDDELSRSALSRLAHGVFESNVAKDGYSRVIGEVREAAGLVSYTQSPVLDVEYGNPTVFARCLDNARQMSERWTGVNDAGRLHFRSHRFSATEVDTVEPWNVDIPLNALAVVPAFRVAWYSDNAAVKDLLHSWCTSWVDAARRTDHGKPRGIMPASISFPDGKSIDSGSVSESLEGASARFRDSVPLYDLLLAMHLSTGDETLLEPMHATMQLVRENEPSSQNDVQYASPSFIAVVEKWRLSTGDTRYDGFLMKRGSPYMRYLLSGELAELEPAFESCIDDLSTNIVKSTSEALFTGSGILPRSRLLFNTMTGSIGDSQLLPLHAVTWEGTGTSLAALVVHASTNRLTVDLFSFKKADSRYSMRVWRLEPGPYKLTLGTTGASVDVQVEERGGRLEFGLPPRELVRMELIRQVDETRARATVDLAIESIEFEPAMPVRGEAARVRVSVANLGIGTIEESSLIFRATGERVKSILAQKIDGTTGLDLSRGLVEFSWTPRTAGRKKIKLELRADVPEITRSNNTVYGVVQVALD